MASAAAYGESIDKQDDFNSIDDIIDDLDLSDFDDLDLSDFD
ncbi:Anionic peptide 17.1 (fragment) [Desulfamplus magnetovallimortis]|uniref:Anionic peptide 17.1 n=1 Tax=Desulfamplus magnetovallimortis TaxID=1246637 RepID=A0A1W1HKL0_9BACT